MTFLVLFVFPLLAYVFLPSVDSSADVSRNADSDTGKLKHVIDNADDDHPDTSNAVRYGRETEDEEEQFMRRRHSRSRIDRRRHSRRGASDKNREINDAKHHVASTEANLDGNNGERMPAGNDDIPVQTDTTQTSNTGAPDSEGTHLSPLDLETEMSDKANTMSNEETDYSNTRTRPSNSDTTTIQSEINSTVSIVADGQPTQTTSNSCPNCGTKEQEKNFRVAMFKQTLLNKLGMSSAPKVDGPLPPLPFDFYLGEDFSVSDEPDDEEEEKRAVKTREVFIFGSDVTHRCHSRKSTGCYSFNLTDKGLDPDEVASIELWIYKQQDLNDHYIQTFMVSELDKSSKKINGEYMLRHRNIAKRIETRLKYGWMKIYVRRTVLRWLSKPHRNNGLAVVCKTCQRQNHKTIYGYKEGMMPILVFYMRQNRGHRRRYKRETDCTGGNCCRKEALEINFQDIGWDYIMAPPSIRPNFCTGSCNGIQAAYYNHTRLVQTLQQSVMHNYGAQLQPCCSPVSFRNPQSLIYRDHHGVVRKIDIPDLIVGECGCT